MKTERSEPLRGADGHRVTGRHLETEALKTVPARVVPWSPQGLAPGPALAEHKIHECSCPSTHGAASRVTRTPPSHAVISRSLTILSMTETRSMWLAYCIV